jgi:hypothetical protein
MEIKLPSQCLKDTTQELYAQTELDDSYIMLVKNFR